MRLPSNRALQRALLILPLALCALPSAGQAAPTRLERAVLEELNYARRHPGDYSEQLQDYRDRFTGRIAHEPDDEIGVGTFEGPRAAEQAIDYVSRLRPIAPLTYDPDLARAAADHAESQSRTGAVGHAQAEGSRLGQRIARYSRGRAMVAEIISYGQPTGERVIRQLIIDDGLGSRPHRADIFNPVFQRVGVACRSHPIYQYVCVIDLSV